MIGKILQTVRVSHKSVLLIWLEKLKELLFHLSDASEELDEVRTENLCIHSLISQLLCHLCLQQEYHVVYSCHVAITCQLST